MADNFRQVRPRWPEEVYDFVRKYTADHPCFFLEELQDGIQAAFPELTNTSVPTLCRALRHDLNMTRKKIQKRAREALPQEIADFKYGLKPFFSYQEQLVFIDERHDRKLCQMTSVMSKSYRPYRFQIILIHCVGNECMRRVQSCASRALDNVGSSSCTTGNTTSSGRKIRIKVNKDLGSITIQASCLCTPSSDKPFFKVALVQLLVVLL
ncbi:hypothetical protein BGZ54_009496, partial [Gamsiella multidivaricata]